MQAVSLSLLFNLLLTLLGGPGMTWLLVLAPPEALRPQGLPRGQAHPLQAELSAGQGGPPPVADPPRLRHKHVKGSLSCRQVRKALHLQQIHSLRQKHVKGSLSCRQVREALYLQQIHPG